MAFPAPEDSPDDAPSLVQEPLGAFLDAVAAATPTPAGGAAAAVSVALAAGLAAKAVRVSAGRLTGEEGLLEAIERLRGDAGRLADADVRAYRDLVEALRRRRQGADSAEQQVQEALRRASEVPARIAWTAAEVARHAARLAGEGKPGVRGDAVAAVLLAEAAARAAGHLVDVNVSGLHEGGDLLRRAAQSADAAHEAVVAVGHQRRPAGRLGRGVAGDAGKA